MLLLRKKELFDFRYTAISDGESYYLGEGPQVFPAPCMSGSKGKALLREVCRIMSMRKVQTLLHGDASPGNVFYRAAANSVTWIDWQLCCKAPHIIPK